MHAYLRFLFQLIIPMSIAAISLCVLCSCQTATSRSPSLMPAPMQVRVIAVSKSSVRQASRYLATLKSRKAVPLKSQVSGQILEILVRSGDHVGKGAELIKLDRTKQQAIVDSLTENMESIAAERAHAEETLKSLQSTLESKKAGTEFARTQVERYSTLLSQGAVSKEQVDQKNVNLKIAEADEQAVESQMKAQEKNISKFQKQINQCNATIKEQRAQLRFFIIGAPIDGAIGDIPVRVGEYVTPEVLLTTVNQNQPLEVYVHVPTARSPQLKEGLSVRLLDAGGKLLGEATTFFVSPQVENDNQSILVKALFDNSKNTLRSGQLVTAEIVWSNAQGLLVPTEAVSMLAGQAFVFLAKEQDKGLAAKQISVELDEIVGNNYHVTSGLHAGDKVICTGVQNLADGMPIAIKE